VWPPDIEEGARLVPEDDAIAPLPRCNAAPWLREADMTRSPEHLTLTRRQKKLVESSAQIQAERPERIDYLHTVQCQCGIPYRNPGDQVREWDRKQGGAVLRIEAEAAMDPHTGQFVKLGLPYGEKPGLVLIQLV
jgi:hypothetical protein